MKIELISKKEHAFLTEQANNPKFVQKSTKWGEYPSKYNFTKEDKENWDKIEQILRKSVVNFSKFHNFSPDKNGEIRIRIDYAWDVHFTGVGYVLIDELLNGFKD